MLTKIMEGFEHLGIVSTVDNKKGIVLIRGTEDTCAEIMQIISFLPFEIEVIENSAGKNKKTAASISSTNK